MRTPFAELQKWLDSLPGEDMPSALDRTSTGYTNKPPAWLAPNGEPYVEFYQLHYARPGDEDVIERVCAEMMTVQLNAYFRDRKGRIYWRKRLETVIEKRDVVLRYDDNGPDTDFMTDRKCIKDGNWMRVACYCRLYREKD